MGGIGREAVLGGRRNWEGGGIGREAVLGGRRYWEGGGIGRGRYWEGQLYQHDTMQWGWPHILLFILGPYFGTL